MSNWTPKQALSELMSKFRRSGSAESSSYSSGVGDRGSVIGDEPELEEQSEYDEDNSPALASLADPRPPDPDETPVSPLAMMNENSPEAWLGQFLLALGMSTPRGT